MLLHKIRSMLGRNIGNEENTEQEEKDYLILMDLIYRLYMLAVDRKIDVHENGENENGERQLRPREQMILFIGRQTLWGLI